MGNYRNEVENTKDYLEGISQMVVNLIDADNKPLRADLMTHLRMVYGHVNWDSLIVKLDKDTIRQIMKNRDNISVGWSTLGRMKEGDYVAILNAETMGPVTYKEMMTDSEVIEVLDLDEAIERAAKWLVDELLESVFSFSLFTPYFLLAFRLALMQGSWPENLRFAEARLNEEWHKTLSSVLFFAGQKLQQEAIGISKRERQIWFNLPENKIEDYLYALNDEE